MLVRADRMSRGLAWEKSASRCWHAKGTPLLVSPKLLRGRGCGQVDVGVIISYRRGKTIHLIECKSGGGGVSGAQYRRLKRSAHFLSVLLGLPSVIEVFAKE